MSTSPRDRHGHTVSRALPDAQLVPNATRAVPDEGLVPNATRAVPGEGLPKPARAVPGEERVPNVFVPEEVRGIGMA